MLGGKSRTKTLVRNPLDDDAVRTYSSFMHCNEARERYQPRESVLRRVSRK